MDVVILIVIFVISFVFYEQIYQIKKILQKKELQDICDYINNKEVYMRDKECNPKNFHAHIIRHENSNHDSIIIDIK